MTLASQNLYDPIKSFPDDSTSCACTCLETETKTPFAPLTFSLILLLRLEMHRRPAIPSNEGTHPSPRKRYFQNLLKVWKNCPRGHDYYDHDDDGCGCLTYELHLDRNCGGTFMVLGWTHLEGIRFRMGNRMTDDFLDDAR